MFFADRASAWIGLEQDGTMVIRAGVTDLGAGQAASLANIAGEILGVTRRPDQRAHRRQRPDPADRRHVRHPPAVHVR